jgi:hypothetical protein
MHTSSGGSEARELETAAAEGEGEGKARERVWFWGGFSPCVFVCSGEILHVRPEGEKEKKKSMIFFSVVNLNKKLLKIELLHPSMMMIHSYKVCVTSSRNYRT